MIFEAKFARHQTGNHMNAMPNLSCITSTILITQSVRSIIQFLWPLIPLYLISYFQYFNCPHGHGIMVSFKNIEKLRNDQFLYKNSTKSLFDLDPRRFCSGLNVFHWSIKEIKFFYNKQILKKRKGVD